MKRYLHSFLYSILTLLFGYVLFSVTTLVCISMHEGLIDWFPSVFKEYSPVLETKEYEHTNNIIEFLSVVLALFLSSLIVTRLDNGRNEYIISKTDGFYKIPDVLPMYYKRYTLPDLIAALLSTVLVSCLIIPAVFYAPEKITWFSNLVVDFREFYIGTLYMRWGVFSAPVAVFLFSFVFKVLSGPQGLKRWRAAWLTYN